MKLKTKIISLICIIALGSSTIAYAGTTNTDIVANLKKQITKLTTQISNLNKQVAALKSNNSKLKTELNGYKVIGSKLNNGQVYLSDLKYYSMVGSKDNFFINSFYSNNSFVINNQKISKGITWGHLSKVSQTKAISYKINNNYKIFKFQYGMEDVHIGEGQQKGIIRLIADDKVIFTSKEIDVQEPLGTAQVNISGVKVLRIEFDTNNTLYGSKYGYAPTIVNPILVQ